MSTKLKIGLFGFGCVGSGLYEVLNQSNLFNANIEQIVVKDPAKKRSIPASNFSYDPSTILDDPSINLVVELIDDADAAHTFVTKAMRKGKSVVTANKKLIAEHLDELLVLKDEYGVSFLYEAAVCGSIPVIRNLEEYYNNDSLTGIEGVCNGTTNYILTRLYRELETLPTGKKAFDLVLSDAQNAGFAESDPTLDIDGFDSKYKLQLLILHTFGIKTVPSEILNLGIRHIKTEDILVAKEKGYKVRFVSYARTIKDRIVAFVAPVLVTSDHFSYGIDNEFNGVAIEARFSDKQVFTGKGAGSFPTASAVLSDVSALQFDYHYEYRKMENINAILADDFEIKVFISSEHSGSLDKVKLLTNEKSFTSNTYSYKVGRIKIAQLSHDLYRNNPDLFIAFYGDPEVSIDN